MDANDRQSFRAWLERNSDTLMIRCRVCGGTGRGDTGKQCPACHGDGSDAWNIYREALAADAKRLALLGVDSTAEDTPA